MEINEALKTFEEYERKFQSISYVRFMREWDMETSAPVEASSIEANLMEYIEELHYNLLQEDRYIECINTLMNNLNEVPKNWRRLVQDSYKNRALLNCVPQEEYIRYQTLLGETHSKYREAKENNNFKIVKPYLQGIIEFKRNYIKWVDNVSDAKGYDVLLDEYEPNFGMTKYDEFFELVKSEIVPLHKKIRDKKKLYNTFNKIELTNEQKTQLAEYLRNVMCLEKNKFVFRHSLCNVTMSCTNKDVRVCVDYGQNLKNFIGSCLHEMGHALYSMQMSDEYNMNSIHDGASQSMHEGQARFFENLVGKSFDFWQAHLSNIKKICPQLQDVSLLDFYSYMNECDNAVARIDSDELSYPIHILIRYEIEKWMFSNDFNIDLLPQKINNMYKEYLGINICDDKDGVLQDIHWYLGAFGYFPAYALGNVYAGQLYNTMSSKFDIKKSMQSATLDDIAKWLKTNVHTFGASKYPKEIMKEATKEEFNPNYYVDYLKEKFGRLYEIDMQASTQNKRMDEITK